MKVLKPPKLNLGDTIGIVASSLPVLPSFRKNYERGKKVIYDLGFKIKEGKTIGQKRWWMAGTPKEVADDINSMFAETDVKAIMVQAGGYSAISVLEYLNYELITNNPKPFIGISDVTNFHLAFFTQVGLVGFHMDDATFGLGSQRNVEDKTLKEFDKEMFLKFLTKNKPPGIINSLTDWEEWKKGQTSGQLLGGNLHILCNLIGTPYFPKLEEFEKGIFYWEEVGQSLYQIVRSLYQLKYLGVLDRISGMLIGKITYIKPVKEKEIVEPTAKEMILDLLKDYHFPIMANLDFGHFTINIPMPLGIRVSFDTTKKELKFLEGTVV